VVRLVASVHISVQPPQMEMRIDIVRNRRGLNGTCVRHEAPIEIIEADGNRSSSQSARISKIFFSR